MAGRVIRSPLLRSVLTGAVIGVLLVIGGIFALSFGGALSHDRAMAVVRRAAHVCGAKAYAAKLRDRLRSGGARPLDPAMIDSSLVEAVGPPLVFRPGNWRKWRRLVLLIVLKDPDEMGPAAVLMYGDGTIEILERD